MAVVVDEAKIMPSAKKKAPSKKPPSKKEPVEATNEVADGGEDSSSFRVDAIDVYQYFLDELSKFCREDILASELNKYMIGTFSDEERKRNSHIAVCALTGFRQHLEKVVDWDEERSALNQKVRKRVSSMNKEKREGLRTFTVKVIPLEEIEEEKKKREEKKKEREQKKAEEIERSNAKRKELKKKKTSAKPVETEEKTE